MPGVERGLKRGPFGFVDIIAQTEFELIVGFVEIKPKGAFCAMDAEK